MRDELKNINKAFESKVRLGIMSALMVNEELDFVSLKTLLELTDGNLASHTKSLEELGYIYYYTQTYVYVFQIFQFFHIFTGITRTGCNCGNLHFRILKDLLKILLKFKLQGTL